MQVIVVKKIAKEEGNKERIQSLLYTIQDIRVRE